MFYYSISWHITKENTHGCVMSQKSNAWIFIKCLISIFLEVYTCLKMPLQDRYWHVPTSIKNELFAQVSYTRGHNTFNLCVMHIKRSLSLWSCTHLIWVQVWITCACSCRPPERKHTQNRKHTSACMMPTSTQRHLNPLKRSKQV